MEATVEEQQRRSQLAQKRKGAKFKQLKIPESGVGINIAEFIIVLLLAMAVDAIDVLDLTGFGAIIARFVDLPALALLWIWRINKHLGGGPAKSLKKNPTFKIIFFFLAEISPFGILPFWTAFVIYAYLGEKRAKKAAAKIKIWKARKVQKRSFSKA